MYSLSWRTRGGRPTFSLGALYIVRDGHCRLSVAKSFGQESIEAAVTVVEVTDSDVMIQFECDGQREK
jgi:hypothetical protein